MSVLNLIKKVKVQTLSFEKHPCRELEQEQMIHYLNGLALITNEDENICEKEREYLSILINSFGLSEEMLETFVNFAENPEEKLILDMMQSFATKDIKYNFMIDAMMTASVDGNFDENEEALIEQYFEMFKITVNEAKDLRYLYEMFYTQNGNALYRYFKRNEYMKVELFQYLLDYYKIDMAYELVEDEKKILTFEFFKPTFKKGKLGNYATEIMTKPVNNAQFCIFLNAVYMDKTIEIDGQGKVVDSKSKDLLMDLDNSDIEFKDGVFLVNSAKDDEKKVTGMTYLMILIFTEWMGQYDNQNYEISSFTYRIVHMNSFENPIFGEFYWGKDSTNKGWKVARLEYSWSEPYFSYDGTCTGCDLRVDERFCSNYSSFRMMKVPEKKRLSKDLK